MIMVVVQVGSTAILARLLSPTDYGLAALATIFVACAAIVVDFGIGSAILHRDSPTQCYLSTAFWLNVGLACGLALIVCGLAVPAAAYFRNDELTGVVIAASAVLLLQIDAVHTSLLRRALRFGRIARIEAVANFLGILVSVVAAYFGGGAYAIVAGPVAQRAVMLASVVRNVHWKPSLQFSGSALASIWQFGRGLTGYSIIQYLGGSADRVLLGRIMNVATLGVYNRAVNVVTLPTTQGSSVLLNVFHPILARLRVDLPRVRDTWLRLVWISWTVGLAAGVALYLAAEPVVAVLYGPQWSEVSQLLRVLAATVPLGLVAATVPPLLQATGNTARQFRGGLATTLFGLGVLVALGHWGVSGIALALTVRSLISAAVGCVQGARVTECGVKALCGLLILPTSGGAIALLVAYLVGAATRSLEGAVLQMAVVCASVAITLTGFLALFGRRRVVWALGRVSVRLGGTRSSSA